MQRTSIQLAQKRRPECTLNSFGEKKLYVFRTSSARRQWRIHQPIRSAARSTIHRGLTQPSAFFHAPHSVLEPWRNKTLLAVKEGKPGCETEGNREIVLFQVSHDFLLHTVDLNTACLHDLATCSLCLSLNINCGSNSFTWAKTQIKEEDSPDTSLEFIA